MAVLAKPINDDPSVDPCIWILLADEALNAGRINQAEALVEQAFLVYDERVDDKAISNAATWWLSSDKEKTQSYPK